MNMDAFRRGLDRYGANLDKWPEPRGRDARELAESDGRLAPLLAEAAAFEAMLKDCDPAAGIGDRRAARVVRRTMRLAAERPQSPSIPVAAGILSQVAAPGGWFPRFAMPMAVAALLGGLLGTQLPGHGTMDAAQTSLATLVAPQSSNPMGL